MDSSLGDIGCDTGRRVESCEGEDRKDGICIDRVVGGGKLDMAKEHHAV
jgi:hypothetical protein